MRNKSLMMGIIMFVLIFQFPITYYNILIKAQQNNYNYAPYFTANNSYVSINDDPNLRLE